MQQNYFDVKTVRKDTRACEKLIHFNNAGSSLMPVPVSDILHEYLDYEEQLGGYETSQLKAATLDKFYIAAAKLLNCKESEIAFTANATRAWAMVFYSFEFKPGDKILTTISEYGSNIIAYLQQAKRYGVEIVFVPDDNKGQIDTKALEAMIDHKVKLISISHIPTSCGLVNPVKKVGEIANAANIPFLLDSCQAVGHVEIDVNDIGCDFLSGTGRKYLRGPRGTGFLYVKESWIEKLTPPLLDQRSADLLTPSQYTLHSDARRFETWECNFAGKAALGVAIDYALRIGIKNIETRIIHLSQYLRSKLSPIPGITLLDIGREKCGIVSFYSASKSCSEIRSFLHTKKINVSTPGRMGNPVLFDQRGISQLVRASIHYFNTEEEIDKMVDVLKIFLKA